MNKVDHVTDRKKLAVAASRIINNSKTPSSRPLPPKPPSFPEPKQNDRSCGTNARRRTSVDRANSVRSFGVSDRNSIESITAPV